MRPLRDLTPDERGAYNVLRSKLSDRTLSAEIHDDCRRKIDELLWKGPNAQVLALREEIANLQARLDRVEFHLGLNDNVVPAITQEEAQAFLRTCEANAEAGKLPPVVASVTIGKTVLPPEAVEPKVVRADCGNQFTIHDEVTTVTDGGPQVTNWDKSEAPEEPKEETRGRKKLRFIPEKNPSGGWMLMDREQNEWLDASPFKTRKDAKEFTDLLNKGVCPKFLNAEAIPDFTPSDGGDECITDDMTLAENCITDDAEPAEAAEDDPLADLGF